MVNRIVVSLIMILMLLGVAIYFRVEFKYGMAAKNHSQILADELSRAKSAAGETERLSSVLKTAQKFGIAFADDYKIIDEALVDACRPKCFAMAEFYDSVDKVVEMIERKKMWVVRKNRTKDSVANYIQNTEEAEIIQTLLVRRTYISDGYSSIASFDLREKALASINLIDAKIKELRTLPTKKTSTNGTEKKEK